VAVVTGNVTHKRNKVLLFAKKESQTDTVFMTLPGNSDVGTMGHFNIRLLYSTFGTDDEESVSKLRISSAS